MLRARVRITCTRNSLAAVAAPDNPVSRAPLGTVAYRAARADMREQQTLPGVMDASYDGSRIAW